MNIEVEILNKISANQIQKYKKGPHYDLRCIQSRVIRMVQHMQIKQ